MYHELKAFSRLEKCLKEFIGLVGLQGVEEILVDFHFIDFLIIGSALFKIAVQVSILWRSKMLLKMSLNNVLKCLKIIIVEVNLTLRKP